MNYCDVQRLFDALMPAGDFRCYWKARYLTGLTDEMIDLAMQNAKAAPSDNTLSSLWNFGGATAEVPAEATAFGDRSMGRSEEHTSELQSLMRISYAVFCLKQKKTVET